MDKKVTSIVAYIGAIGWVIAFLAGDKEGAKFHMNQALVLLIINSISVWIPIFGWAVSVAITVFSIMGIVYAAQDQEKELPFVGQFKIMN